MGLRPAPAGAAPPQQETLTHPTTGEELTTERCEELAAQALAQNNHIALHALKRAAAGKRRFLRAIARAGERT